MMNIHQRLAKRLPLFLLFGAVLATSLAIRTTEAQEPLDGSCPLLTELVFVNGVRNTAPQANLSRGHTAGLYRREILQPGEVLTSSVAYNYTSGPDQIFGPGHGLDFIQAISQIAAQYEISITDVLDIARGLPLPTRLASLPTTLIIEVLYEKFAQQDWLAEFTLNEHLQKYDEFVAEGKRVILVAHSQGNLFANAAYKALAPEVQAHVGVVGVATPASNVAGDSNWLTARYLTAFEDWVIWLVPTSLPSNEVQGNKDGDASGHAYVEFYLREGSNTQARIRALLMLASQEVPSPPNDCEDEPPSPPPPPPTTSVCTPPAGKSHCSVSVNFVDAVGSSARLAPSTSTRTETRVEECSPHNNWSHTTVNNFTEPAIIYVRESETGGVYRATVCSVDGRYLNHQHSWSHTRSENTTWPHEDGSCQLHLQIRQSGTFIWTEEGARVDTEYSFRENGSCDSWLGWGTSDWETLENKSIFVAPLYGGAYSRTRNDERISQGVDYSGCFRQSTDVSASSAALSWDTGVLPPVGHMYRIDVAAGQELPEECGQ